MVSFIRILIFFMNLQRAHFSRFMGHAYWGHMQPQQPNDATRNFFENFIELLKKIFFIL